MTYSSTVLADSPVAYYRLDEGSGASMLDSSGNSRGGAYLNGAVPSAASLLAAQPSDAALTLDGVDDYASVAYDASWMTPTTAFTVEFWMKPSTVAGNHFILGRANYATSFGNTWAWHFNMAGATLQFNVFTGNSGTNTSLSWGTALVANTTYHVVGTFDGTTMLLYVNAAAPATAGRSGTMNTAPNINLTLGACHQSTVAERFQGTLDEVAIYNAVLSATQISAHYTAGTSAAPTEVTGAFTGSGTLGAAAKAIQPVTAAASGSGTLSATTGQTQAVTGQLVGSGTLSATASGGVASPDEMASLHTDDPGLTGAHEVTGGGYAREVVAWTLGSDGTYTSAPMDFAVPAGDIAWAALWGADGGFVRKAVAMATFPDGGTYRLVLHYDPNLDVMDASLSDRVITFEIVFAILDDVLDQAPGMLLVAVEEGPPDAEVDFQIDGTLVYTAILDSDGALPPISVPVPETVMAGTHSLTLTSPDGAVSTMGAVSFTVLADPDPLPESVGPDADPVEVPAAVSTSVRRWVLQDLRPGGLGSWVMPSNPATADPFPFKRTLTSVRTQHVNGRYHITEPIGEVFAWSFAGRYADRATQDQLEAFTALDRRFYLIDHRNRAWTVAFLGVDLVPRKRIVDDDGSFDDETGDYIVRALVYGHEWKVPQ